MQLGSILREREREGGREGEGRARKGGERREGERERVSPPKRRGKSIS